MEILIFLAGLFAGVLCTTIYFVVLNRNTKKSYDSMLNEMKLAFELTANKIFKENSQELSVHNKEKLEEFYTRFKDRIENFEKLAKENLDKENENFTKFDSNIQNFLAAGNKISQDTTSLLSLMRGDNRTQGNWGELVLEKVLQTSGLRAGEEYSIQKSMSEGRPDATVYLPDGRCVYIDSKTSFAAWDGYINAVDDATRKTYLKEFKTSTKAHITGLVKRDYASDAAAPDFVLMFIPIESCYSLMFCDDCELWDFAWKNNIMPVSPSTLLAALKIINSFYFVDRQNKNAKQISELASRMLDKFVELYNELLKARENLDNSIKKLDGKDNIMRQIERMQECGVKMSKTFNKLPEEQM